MKHRFLIVRFCLLLGLCAPALGHADGGGFERTFGKDLFASGANLRVEQPVEGDLLAAGGQVESRAEVAGDALLGGGEVRAEGRIGENLYLMGGRLLLRAQVARNARVAGGQVELDTPSQIVGNLSVAGGDLRLKGTVGGHVQAAGGRLLLDGAVAGDVEARAGQIELGPNARITGKLRYAARDELRRDPAAQVLGGVERFALEGDWPGTERLRHGLGRTVGGIWALGLVLLAGVLMAAWPHATGGTARTLRHHPLLSLLLGFVLLLCLPVAAVLLMLTLLGLPLGLLVLMLYPALLLLGPVCTGIALGTGLMRGVMPAWSRRRSGQVVGAMLGVLALALLVGFVPWAGALLMALALLLGVGAIGLQAWRGTPEPAPVSAPAASPAPAGALPTSPTPEPPPRP